MDLQQIEARYTPESARGFSPACRPSGGRNSAAAPVAAKTRSSRRRLNGDICSVANMSPLREPELMIQREHLQPSGR